MRSVFLCTLSLLLVVGCSSGPLVRDAPDLSAPAEFPNHSVEQILAHIAVTAAADSLVAFSSQAHIEIRTPGRDADLSATIRQRAADTLWASARGPLSIEVARALATPDSVKVLDKLNDRLYIGTMEAATALLPVPISTGDLFKTFLGTLRPEPEIRWSLRAESDSPGDEASGPRYVLTHPEGHSLYVIDPASWRTVRYWGLVGNEVVDERTFSAFDRVEGRILPRRVELRNPQTDAALTIEHRRLTLNPAILDFPFAPGDAEVRRLD